SVLDSAHAALTEVEDAGCQNRVRTRRNGRREVAGCTRATGGDDRDGHDLAYRGEHLGVEAILGAVGVHGVEQDLPHAQLLALLGPGHGIQAGGLGTAVRGDLVDRKSTRLNSSHVSISYAVF